MKILFAEDNTLLADGIIHALTKHNYVINWVDNGEHVSLALQTEQYDLLILDLGLPRKDGIMVLKQMRQDKINIPVLILTARDSLDDKVLGLDAGADDYLVKPFELDELLARIRALLRRSKGRISELIEYKGIKIELSSRGVTYQEQLVSLTRREFNLLVELLENRGRVLTREQLESSLYSLDDDVESNALEVHIHHLRKKFFTSLIKTIRGIGYMIQVET
ncbi:MAG: response regulator [Pseudomonadota bacterium]